MSVEAYIRMLENRGIDYRADFDLSAICSYGTGGKAKVVVFPKSAEELKGALGEIDYEIVGSGTNVLFSDHGYDGAIIVTTNMKKIECNGLSVVAECGALLSSVRETAALNSLGGLEFTEGIPATVGGAVCMNAGCFSKCVGDYVSYVVTGSGVISGADCGFGYRSSVFLKENPNGGDKGDKIGCGTCGAVNGVCGESASTDCNEQDGGTCNKTTDYADKARKVIAAVCFILKPSEPDVIDAKRERFRKLRKNAQPHGKSCGSVFLNDGYFAGKVIDSAGLKGASIGGAHVSEKHANFILAESGARSEDVYRLIGYVKKRVYETQGVSLKEEVRFIGKFDD